MVGRITRSEESIETAFAAEDGANERGQFALRGVVLESKNPKQLNDELGPSTDHARMTLWPAGVREVVRDLALVVVAHIAPVVPDVGCRPIEDAVHLHLGERLVLVDGERRAFSLERVDSRVLETLVRCRDDVFEEGQKRVERFRNIIKKSVFSKEMVVANGDGDAEEGGVDKLGVRDVCRNVR